MKLTFSWIITIKNNINRNLKKIGECSSSYFNEFDSVMNNLNLSRLHQLHQMYHLGDLISSQGQWYTNSVLGTERLHLPNITTVTIYWVPRIGQLWYMRRDVMQSNHCIIRIQGVCMSHVVLEIFNIQGSSRSRPLQRDHWYKLIDQVQKKISLQELIQLLLVRVIMEPHDKDPNKYLLLHIDTHRSVRYSNFNIHTDNTLPDWLHLALRVRRLGQTVFESLLGKESRLTS